MPNAFTPGVLKEECQRYNAENRTIIDNHCGIIDESHIRRDVEDASQKNCRNYWDG